MEGSNRNHQFFSGKLNFFTLVKSPVHAMCIKVAQWKHWCLELFQVDPDPWLLLSLCFGNSPLDLLGQNPDGCTASTLGGYLCLRWKSTPGQILSGGMVNIVFFMPENNYWNNWKSDVLLIACSGRQGLAVGGISVESQTVPTMGIIYAAL